MEQTLTDLIADLTSMRDRVGDAKVVLYDRDTMETIKEFEVTRGDGEIVLEF